jgi:hypothetical protein
LRTTVQVALLAPMAMCVLWGRNYVQIYNDAYREIMGVKHPAGLGQSNRDCWPEVWHLNEGLYARVLAGEAIELHHALYPITRRRSEILEDAWFDLFFIPIREGTAAVGGILAAVVEKTREVLAARRLSTLHQLTDRTAGATTWKAALKGAIAVLAAAEDVPFAVGYRVDRAGVEAVLIDAVGVKLGVQWRHHGFRWSRAAPLGRSGRPLGPLSRSCSMTWPDASTVWALGRRTWSASTPRWCPCEIRERTPRAGSSSWASPRGCR